MLHRPPATLIADAHIAAGFHVGCRQSVSHQRFAFLTFNFPPVTSNLDFAKPIRR
jgi:hypothetical protein